MSTRRTILGAAAVVLIAGGPVSAQHGGGHGGGGHAGGAHMGGHPGGHPGGVPGGHPGAYGAYHHGGYYGGYRGGFYGGPFYGYGYGLGYGLGYPSGYGFGYGLNGYSYPINGSVGLGVPYNTGYYSPPNPAFVGPAVGSGILPPGPGPGPADPIPAAPGTAPNPAPDQNKELPISTPAANSAKLSVVVPEGGQVWFDNVLTPETGNRWVYTSPQLEPGRTYSVAIKARWGEGEQAKSYEIPVRVQAGDNMTIDLSRTR